MDQRIEEAARDRALRQEFGRVREKIDDLIKGNDARDKGIKREFRNVYEKMDSGFSRVDERLRHADERMHKMSLKLDSMEALFANFRVVHLNQRIQAIPVYDSSHQPVPVPKCFPKTALRLYRLQDRKNWNQLKTLLKHYNLEMGTIRLVDRGELYDSSDSDNDSDTSSRFLSIDRELDRAIEANPFAAMCSLGRHLGVDTDSLHDRVTQLEFQQKKGTVTKRPAEDVGSVRKMIRDLVTGALQPGSFTRADPLLDDDSEGKHTKLEWEVDSEKFKRETAHLRLRDTEISPRRQQKDLEVLDIPAKCGILSAREIDITENYDATDLLQKNDRGTPSWPSHQFETFNVAGVPTSLGFVSYLDRPAPTTNSALFNILRAAGAVLYVKTNVPQTMMTADSHNNVFGRVINPYRRHLTAGGSSGGEGALIALRGSVLGIGTDIAGSIQIPALCCGTIGFKPSVGRVAYGGQTAAGRGGMVGIAPVVGPLCHSIRDAELVLRTVLNSQPEDLDDGVVGFPWCDTPSKAVLTIGVMAEEPKYPIHPPMQRTLALVVKNSPRPVIVSSI
ncbi:hypothetical protein CDV55_107663 [Aspergillus turcosus]|uniref:Amidase domain-containing protein n=1 Tax=Aspergillus turcosus TaxID=1245748 RepID=A0A397HX80_9EURO|nr:hypothetical protein CDV55_107663 [Aspergillus turcosus]RLL97651.1 hypothetical protein CFD26_101963 [Aspergillus turcosus]